MENNKTTSNINGKEVDVFLLIFKHNAAVFEFAPSMADVVYDFDYDLYYDTEGFEETDTLSGLFLDNMVRASDLGKSIMVIHYNPRLALIAKAVVEAIEKEEPKFVFCLSFFHDDEITSNLRRKTRVFNMLDQKFSVIESMLDYPFIKKYNIPYNLAISEEYLTDILHELY
jgi:phosphoribosyl 1,2-cyclic phosphodiesterase